MKEISETLLRFILEHIDSVEQLRILLLFFKEPERGWTIAEINRELTSTDTSIKKRMEGLSQRKLIEQASEEIYKLGPISKERQATLQELARLFEVSPYRVIELIFSQQKNTIQAFADAFKIKKDDKS